ncbi:hypothetical protein ACROYT_G040327 [Oculina patagonica]
MKGSEAEFEVVRAVRNIDVDNMDTSSTLKLTLGPIAITLTSTNLRLKLAVCLRQDSESEQQTKGSFKTETNPGNMDTHTLIVALTDWCKVTLTTPNAWLIVVALFVICGTIVVVKAMQSDVEIAKARAEQEKEKARAEQEKAKAKAKQNECRLF